jgi:Domain of unknown function (DUF4276)
MIYKRLNITAEGQTEMKFAKDTLSKYFVNFGLTVNSRPVMTSKDKNRTFRGGLIDYERAKKDILNWIKEDKSEDVYFSTMFDLYALPDNFPKFNESRAILDPYQRIEFLENALAEDIGHHKFIAYIQLHEFEALLLSNPAALLDEYFDKKSEIDQLIAIVDSHDGNPEKVNTGRETAPSKRIIKLIPEYDGNKVTVGAHLAGSMGVEFLKNRCKHFSDWIEKLERLSEIAPPQ